MMEGIYREFEVTQAIITQLYPDRCEYESVEGLYLAEGLYQRTRTDRPLVYANFVSSLDGRIAISHENTYKLPENLSNGNDLRLFLELLVQADCLITHSAYLRDRAAGQLGDIFHIDNDLSDWRSSHGLAPPTIVICSSQLDFPEPLDLDIDQVIIATGKRHDAARAKYWRDKGYRLITAGNDTLVEVNLLLNSLADQNLRNIYFVAGPKLLESAFKDRCLDLLYLTLSHQLVGGNIFQTLTPSANLSHCQLIQKHLIFDNSPQLKYPQWFTKFECRYR